MTCKDCLYHECCHSEIAYGMGSDDLTGKYLTDIETRCKSFKNKHDVAEVCRCKDCKYIDVVTCPITGTERLYCDFGTQPVYVRDSHFCSYGERKEGAGE